MTETALQMATVQIESFTGFSVSSDEHSGAAHRPLRSLYTCPLTPIHNKLCYCEA